ncbi:hypothetical protein ACSSS7_000737 [Eimeria intestinalis]
MDEPAAAGRRPQPQQQQMNLLLPLLTLGVLALVPSLLSLASSTASSLSSSSSSSVSNSSSSGGLGWLLQPHNPLPAVISPHQQLSSFLQQHLGHLEGFRVVPMTYKPAPLVQYLAAALDALRWLLLLLLLLPRQLLPLLLPRDRAEAYVAAAENNRVVLMGVVFVVGNLLVGLLMQSAAFEIYYERDLVWSALFRQRQGLPTMPSGLQLLQALEEAGAPLQRVGGGY